MMAGTGMTGLVDRHYGSTGSTCGQYVQETAEVADVLKMMPGHSTAGPGQRSRSITETVASNDDEKV
jgi:hypothetical protein